jgi:hypothetical protein
MFGAKKKNPDVSSSSR